MPSLPSKTTLCVLLSVNTIKALLHSETLIYTNVLRDKSLVNTIQAGFETAWLLFALIECMQAELGFTLLSK